jgi:hypothetical protein
MNLQKKDFTTGKQNPMNRPSDEGAIFEMTSHGGLLNIYYIHPTALEIRDIDVGINFKMGIKEFKDIAVILFKFPHSNWLECPFHAGLYDVKFLFLHDDDKTSALSMVLTDYATNIIKATRMVSIPAKLNKALFDVVVKQQNNPISMEMYHRQINEMYGCYPEIGMLAEHADICMDVLQT